MKLHRLLIFILIILLLALLSYFYHQIQSIATGKSIDNNQQTTYQKEQAWVIKIIDGDTIETDQGTIRLLGINNLRGMNI